MDFSTLLTLKSTGFFCSLPVHLPNPGSPRCYKKNPIKKSGFYSISQVKIQTWRSNSTIPSRETIPISARLGPPIRRRNTLREKITLATEYQVRSDSYLPNSESKTENLDGSSLNLDKSKGDSENGSNESEQISKDSILWDKLYSWASQYKQDVELWGVGSDPIFTIYQNSNNKITRVMVNKDEIVRRSKIQESEYIDSKLSHAIAIAKEIESGLREIPSNSSVFRYVTEKSKYHLVESMVPSVFRSVVIIKNLPRVGFSIFCFYGVILVVTKLIWGNNKGEMSKEETEMLERKRVARMKREELERGSVKVLDSLPDQLTDNLIRPQLDKSKLMERIKEIEVVREDSVQTDLSSNLNVIDLSGDKVREIREMVSKVHELERQNNNLNNEQNINDKENPRRNNTSMDGDNLTFYQDQNENSVKYFVDAKNKNNLNNIIDPTNTKPINCKEDTVSGTSDAEKALLDTENSLSLNGRANKETGKRNNEMKNSIQADETLHGFSKNSKSSNPRIITSVKEAREYLAKNVKKGKLADFESLNENPKKNSNDKLGFKSLAKGSLTKTIENLNGKNYNGTSSSSRVEPDNANTLLPKSDIHFKPLAKGYLTKTIENLNGKNYNGTSSSSRVEPDNASILVPKSDIFVDEKQIYPKTPEENNEICKKKEEWIENNMEVLSPIINKIGTGFQENYKMAKERAQDLALSVDIRDLGSLESENEWMNDDRLREIVSRVAENELAGRDPFHMMSDDDKNKFFEGLERKVERVNEKLLPVHEWLHSRIENLDYGVDGISVYDPVEKIVPRWKGPDFDKMPEFIQKSTNKKGQSEKNLQKIEENPTKKSKILIECSDGTSKLGKKGAREHWQHTKRWSQNFLEVYNSEPDPEVKSVLKEMGKDLDRWLTEDELENKRDYSPRAKSSKRKKEFVRRKMERIKMEVERFGAAAVVSKYREYGDKNEVDYFWWLDLPFVLCIELYTKEGDTPKVGFYSLEMAGDLELDPKQYHIIAFEDASDSKNFCYIVQSHLDMLGYGKAFVVARPPKDAFREAKADGFNISVIRKGEIKLNVDQSLEEIEEEITEIGSKMYHDKIMNERSVDVGTIMKGLISSEKSTKQKSRPKLMKPTKQ